MHIDITHKVYNIPAIAVGDTACFGKTKQLYKYLGTEDTRNGLPMRVWETHCKTCSVCFRVYTAIESIPGIVRNCQDHREGFISVKNSKGKNCRVRINDSKEAVKAHTARGKPFNLSEAIRLLPTDKLELMKAFVQQFSPMADNARGYSVEEFAEAKLAYYNTLVDNTLEDMI